MAQTSRGQGAGRHLAAPGGRGRRSAGDTQAQRRERADQREACVDVRQEGEHDVRGQGRAVHLLQEAHAADLTLGHARARQDAAG